MKKQGNPKNTKNLPEKTTEQAPEERSLTNPNGSTGRKGIPIERILACRAKGLTIKETALLCQCSEQNVVNRCSEFDLETLADFNGHKVSIYDIVERKHLNKLLDGESKRPMEDMTIAAIAGDKGRLIRGQATEIIDHRVMVLDLGKAIQAMRAESSMPIQGVESGSQVIDFVQCPDGGEE